MSTISLNNLIQKKVAQNANETMSINSNIQASAGLTGSPWAPEKGRAGPRLRMIAYDDMNSSN